MFKCYEPISINSSTKGIQNWDSWTELHIHVEFLKKILIMQTSDFGKCIRILSAGLLFNIQL